MKGTLTPGTVLVGRYKLIRPLAQGAMAAVFEAEQLGLGRRVALKTIHPEKRDEQQLRRLAREAEVAASLNHPNIVQITDVHIASQGSSFLVMELLHGEALDARQASGPISVREVVRIARQILDGLACAHDAKLVHRDLKPANVFLTKTAALGQVVKLLDFGVVRIEDRRTRLTKTGNIVGTPAYMAPEQVRGQNVGPGADLWSLGVIIYELLSGQLPFDAATWQELLGVIISDDPRPLTEVAAHVPIDLGTIVHHALQKDPAKRYRDARQMEAALAEVEQRLDARSQAPKPKPVRRNTPVLGGIGHGHAPETIEELHPSKAAGVEPSPVASPLDLREQLSTQDNVAIAHARDGGSERPPPPMELADLTGDATRRLLLGAIAVVGVLSLLAVAGIILMLAG